MRSKNGKLVPVFLVYLLICNLITQAQKTELVKQEAKILIPNRSVEETLKGGETRSYQIDLKENQFMRVIVDQIGIDVVVSLFAVDEKLIEERDTPNDKYGEESLSAQIITAGTYRIQIKALQEEAETGRYLIKLETLRTVTELDKNRVKAEKNFQELNKLLPDDFLQSRKEIIVKYEELILLWSDIGDSYAEGLTLMILANIYEASFENDKAIETATKALVIFRVIKNRDAEGDILIVLARLLRRKGNYEQSLNYAKDLASAKRNVQNKQGEIDTLRGAAETLSSFGVAQNLRGEPMQAVKTYRSAIIFYQLVEDKTGEADLLNLIGKIYYTAGDKTKALYYYNRALLLFRESNNDAGEARTNEDIRSIIPQKRPLKVELIVQRGHSGSIMTLTYSPDGKTLASGSADSTIRLWNVEQGKELRTFFGHVDKVLSLAFSADGKTLISGSYDGTIRLWNVESGKELRKLLMDPENYGSAKAFSPVSSVAFCPNKRIVGAASGTKVKFWDIDSGKELLTLFNQRIYADSIRFSPDGKILATGGVWADKSIKFWDMDTGKQLPLFPNNQFNIYSVTFSPNWKILASVSNNTITLWDVNTGKESGILSEHSDLVELISFSPNGAMLASSSRDNTIKLWDVKSRTLLRTLLKDNDGDSPLRYDSVYSVLFSPDGKTLASGSNSNKIRFWDVESGKSLRKLSGHTLYPKAIAFSPDGRTFVNGSSDNTIKFWDLATSKPPRMLSGHSDFVSSVVFSPDGETLASGSGDKTIKLWNTENDKEILTLTGHSDPIGTVIFSPNGKTIASSSSNLRTDTIKLWDIESGKEMQNLLTSALPSSFRSVAFNQNEDTSTENGEALAASVHLMGADPPFAFSPNGEVLATRQEYKNIKLWNLGTGGNLIFPTGHSFDIFTIAYSPKGKILASGSYDVRLMDVESGRELRIFTGHSGYIWSIAFSPDGKTLASGGNDNTIKLWNVEKNGKALRTFIGHSSSVRKIAFSLDGKLLASLSLDATIKIWDVATGKELCSLINLNQEHWIVITPDGRFDTNKIEDTEGLHWVISDQPFQPLALDILMRQYYEPNLLHRILNCNKENNCEKEFKSLPSIANINRIQPKVNIKEIKSVADSLYLVDVTIEVESVTKDISEKDKTGKKQSSSGAFDLRLFRDGQLVGVSTPKDKLAQFISDAPRLVAETNASGKLIDTPEDQAWRRANDIFKLKSENVKFISSKKVEYTFRNVKLPRDGRKEVELTAYVFNSDKVKSATTAPVKFSIPTSNPPKKGRAFILSIGVNASENPSYNLRYAANDARKMQEIVGALFKANSDKYSEVIQIPLISDYGKDNSLTENNAQKKIIKSVFSLLAGNEREVPAEILTQIPNHNKIIAVEPEDTLIITYSGHGYADRSGIFYLLPYDVGKNTTKLMTQILPKAISSDELSLWMQDITAAEMIVIIDACHSSAAIQGDGFKPGPMGSRGLGQLAYDKGMEILAATQSNNVALEISKLQQGLLSYVLLVEGIVNKKADTEVEFNQLTVAEWLGYAVKQVPRRYEDILTKRGGVLINENKVVVKHKDVKKIDLLSGKAKTDNDNLQQPVLFDFRQRNKSKILFSLL